jgi:Holliday junction resolvase RusA-like endonuclease
MLILEFTFYGEPVPFQRPRFNGRFAFNDTRYSAYKKDLATAVQKECRGQITPAPEPNTKARSLFLNTNRYKLRVRAYRSRNTGDVDNFVKTVLDALQDSGVIADDCQVDKIIGEKFIDKVCPRISFLLEQTQSQEQFQLAIGRG